MKINAKGAVALLFAALYGAAVAAPVNTVGIEFESPALAKNFNGGTSFFESGFTFTTVDPNGAGFVGSGSGSPDVCAFIICPSRASAYFAVLNDGALMMQRSGGNSFQLAGFDLGFIANAFDPSLIGPLGQILVTGMDAGGPTTASFDLQGLSDVSGVSSFAHYDFNSAFSAKNFSSVSFTACLNDGNGGCTPGASFNLAQFGLDSVQVIPEPTSYALVALGLLAAGAATRRRRSL